MTHNILRTRPNPSTGPREPSCTPGLSHALISDQDRRVYFDRANEYLSNVSLLLFPGRCSILTLKHFFGRSKLTITTEVGASKCWNKKGRSTGVDGAEERGTFAVQRVQVCISVFTGEKGAKMFTAVLFFSNFSSYELITFTFRNVLRTFVRPTKQVPDFPKANPDWLDSAVGEN